MADAVIRSRRRMRIRDRAAAVAACRGDRSRRRRAAPAAGATEPAVLLASVLPGLRRTVRGRQDLRRRVRRAVAAAVLGRRRADRVAAGPVRRDCRVAVQRDGTARVRRQRSGVPARHPADGDDHAVRGDGRLSLQAVQGDRAVRRRSASAATPTPKPPASTTRARTLRRATPGSSSWAAPNFACTGGSASAWTPSTRTSPGILGTAGISQAFGENDLGGTAVRVKILVGR